jgi:cytochrome c-type biogenesis protein CcmH
VKRWPWVVLLLVIAGAVVVLVARSQPSSAPAARANRLEHELACPVCEGQSVAESNAPESVAIRADIPNRIREGQSDAEIRAAYAHIYGDRILLTPSNSGLGLVAWGLPVGAILLGAAGIGYALWRWSHAPRLASTVADEELVREEREHEDADEDA